MKSLIVLLAVSISFSVFAKGAAGHYFIEGTAYSAAKTILSDALITVQHNGESTDYMTDSKGRFKIKINWTIPYKSGIPTNQWDGLEEKYNEETIHIYFKCQGTTLSNQWKIYSGLSGKKPNNGVRNVDLHFKN